MTVTVTVTFGDVVIKQIVCASHTQAAAVARRERESLARWWGPRDYSVQVVGGAGTNGGTMPCGAKLTMLGVTAPYYCAKCEPGPGGAA